MNTKLKIILFVCFIILIGIFVYITFFEYNDRINTIENNIETVKELNIQIVSSDYSTSVKLIRKRDALINQTMGMIGTLELKDRLAILEKYEIYDWYEPKEYNYNFPQGISAYN
jgi:hypothetical protein